jgi:hypothetical protein
MSVTVGTRGQAHGRVIEQRARIARRQREPNMTATFTTSFRKAGLALVFAASISAVTSTSGFAFSAEAQSMCSGDAFRLCSSEIPNIPAITACMVSKRSSLSSGCRVVLDRDLAAQKSGKLAAQ